MKVTTKLIIIGIILILIFVIGLYFLINYLHHNHNSGWTKENIQSLSKEIYEKIKDSPITTMSVSQKNADCIANAISSNHPYDSKYQEDPLLNIPKKYITQCFSPPVSTTRPPVTTSSPPVTTSPPRVTTSPPPINTSPRHTSHRHTSHRHTSPPHTSPPHISPPTPVVTTCPLNCQVKNSCNIDECVGNCGTCANNMVCSSGTCNGNNWSIAEVEELTNVLQNKSYVSDSFTKLCINPDSAKCLATNIASENYNSPNGYITAQEDVIKYTPKYFTECLKPGCAGVEGEWDKSIYDEMTDKAINVDQKICEVNYRQQLDPIEYFSNMIWATYDRYSNVPDAKKAVEKVLELGIEVKNLCYT